MSTKEQLLRRYEQIFDRMKDIEDFLTKQLHKELEEGYRGKVNKVLDRLTKMKTAYDRLKAAPAQSIEDPSDAEGVGFQKRLDYTVRTEAARKGKELSLIHI